MPTNQIRIPELNPVRFVPVGTPLYQSFGNDWFYNLIQPWQSAPNYAQKWVVGDLITLQFVSNFGPLQLDVIDCSGSILATHGVTLVATDIYSPLFTIYQSVFTPPSISGWWYIKFTIGSDDTTEIFISEPQQTNATIEGLMRVDCWNSFNKDDFYFAAGAKLACNI